MPIRPIQRHPVLKRVGSSEEDDPIWRCDHCGQTGSLRELMEDIPCPEGRDATDEDLLAVLEPEE